MSEETTKPQTEDVFESTDEDTESTREAEEQRSAKRPFVDFVEHLVELGVYVHPSEDHKLYSSLERKKLYRTILKQASTSADARSWAALMLKQIGEPAVPALIEMLRDADADIRRSAVQALEQMGEPAVSALIEALGDPKIDIQESAVVAEQVAAAEVDEEETWTERLGIAFSSQTHPKGKQVRYNLRLPAEVYDEISRVAARNGTTILEVIRKSIILGLMVDRMQQRDEYLHVKRGGEMVEMRLIY